MTASNYPIYHHLLVVGVETAVWKTHQHVPCCSDSFWKHTELMPQLTHPPVLQQGHSALCEPAITGPLCQLPAHSRHPHLAGLRRSSLVDGPGPAVIQQQPPAEMLALLSMHSSHGCAPATSLLLCGAVNTGRGGLLCFLSGTSILSCG